MNGKNSNALRKGVQPHPAVYREAMSMRKAGHRVIIYAWDRSGNRPEREIVEGIEVVNIHGKSSYGTFFDVAKGMDAVRLSYLTRGRYAEHIERFGRVFPDDRFSFLYTGSSRRIPRRS